MEISSSHHHHHHHAVQATGRRITNINCRENSRSPEKVRNATTTRRMITSKMATFKKVQVVYYLSRNGHLEHPHYMEVTHLAHHHLRLKDVIDRLIVLRGKGMPSLYSWSCKRSYKNGYVWNDLAENDVIYPSEGAEYVLKGSLLIQSNCSSTEKMNHLQVSNIVQVQDSNNFQPKPHKSLALKRRVEPEEMVNNQYFHDHEDEQKYEHEEEEYEEESKISYPRCSRGVSTDEIEQFKQDTNSFSSPPSTTSSTLSEKPNANPINTPNNTINNNNNTNSSTIFEDGDPVGNEPLLSRNSMLLSLIACGGSTSFRKTVPPPSPPSAVVARKSGVGDMLKGVVCKAAAEVALDEEVMMIGCMSENPRFGNLQGEEKEYFSGSIVESITNERSNKVDHQRTGLKKSSSHKEERSTIIVSGLGDEVEKEVKKEKGVKGKCIPRKKSSSKQSKK